MKGAHEEAMDAMADASERIRALTHQIREMRGEAPSLEQPAIAQHACPLATHEHCVRRVVRQEIAEAHARLAAKGLFVLALVGLAALALRETKGGAA